MAIASEDLATLGHRTAAAHGRTDLTGSEAHEYGHKVSEALRTNRPIPSPNRAPASLSPGRRPSLPASKQRSAPAPSSQAPGRVASAARSGGDALYSSLPDSGAGTVGKLISATIAGLVVLEIAAQLSGKYFNLHLGAPYGGAAGKTASASADQGGIIPLYPGQTQDLAALKNAGHVAAAGNAMPGHFGTGVQV